ncbi:unnamed protein product [Laminaria digitata]
MFMAGISRSIGWCDLLLCSTARWPTDSLWVICTLLPLLSLWTTEGSCAVAWRASVPADMVSPDLDKALLDSVFTGNMTRLESAVAGGANVNGSPKLPCPPITAAAARDEVRMISFLIDHGADPNRPVKRELPPSNRAMAIMPGERALHIAANRGNVEIVRLLKRAGADPNLADKRGGTPLLVILGCCTSLRVGVEMVRLLLEAGADPGQADEIGFVPLHLAAKGGHLELVDLLHAAAPSSCGLNAVSVDGRTPLFAACCEGHEEVVSRLLSLGATQRVDNHSLYPLGVATRKGFLSVVRLLLKDRMRAVGGTTVLPYALHMAISHHQPRVLRLLLGVDGDKKRAKWANSYFDDRRLIHYGVCLCSPAEVAVLIAAGADETSSGYGRVPRDDIGVDLALDGLRMDRGKEVALRRMLEQGPAYRARSWAWPTEEAGGGDGGGGGKAVPSSPPATPKLPVGLRIVRPNSDRKLFARVVGRYCLKGHSTY